MDSGGEGEAFFEFGLIPDRVKAFDNGSGGVGDEQRWLIRHADRSDRRCNRRASGIGEDFGVDEREGVFKALLSSDECFEGGGRSFQ